jgi:hypothetical protein
VTNRWWNDDLTSLWNEVCSAEKIWLKCQNSHRKKELRHIYVQKRKIFDRNVKKAKRQNWHSMQEELVNSQGTPKEFWRKIGKIGVGSERRNTISMEVKIKNGSICNDKNLVLDKWKNDFSNMLNKNYSNNTDINSNSEIIHDEYLDSEITTKEVYNVLKCPKNRKSPGVDDIQVELYIKILLH